VKVRNWERYQAVKRQGAEYVRLYTALVYDADYNALSVTARELLTRCWMVAGQTGNKLPDSPAQVLRLCNVPRCGSTRRALDSLVDAEWLAYDRVPVKVPVKVPRKVPNRDLIGDPDRVPIQEVLAIHDNNLAPQSGAEYRESIEREENRTTSTPKNWLAPTAVMWERQNGAGSFAAVAGRIGKALKPLAAHHAPEKIAEHVEQYAEETPPQFWNWDKFAASFALWEHKPIIDPKTGWYTEYGERVTRPAGYKP
jgi:hypothetical protein